MTKPQDLPWKKISVEAVTIVGSILLAFAIDAWWQDRQVRVEEQEILAGLHAEFVANHEVISRNLAASINSLQSLEDFLTLAESGPLKDTKAIVLTTIVDLRSPYTTDLGNGTLKALLSSGRLEILRSKKLRSSLAAWDGVVGEFSDDEANGVKMVYEIFIPYLLQENYSWYEIDRASEDSTLIRRLLTDETFRHLVRMRYILKSHLAGEFEQAIAAADEIIEVLEESIE